jgi:Peptidase family M28/PDZ domain/PA domain
MPKRMFPASMRWLTALSLALLAATTFAQQPDVIQERMKKDIYFLASPECEGRGVDTKGINVAADYIANQIKQAGLKPGGKDGTYWQPFTIAAGGKGAVKGDSSFTLTGPAGQTVALQFDKDFQVLPGLGSGKVESPIVFAGYGLTVPAANYDDFKDLDVKGKIVVVIRRVPRWDNEALPFAGDKNAHAGLETKIANCEKNGAAAVIVVNDRSEVADGDKFMAAGSLKLKAGIPVAQLRRGVLDTMLVSAKGTPTLDVEKDIDRDLKPRSGLITGWSGTLATTAKVASFSVKNIVGTLEGAGPLANETIVVGAHYDHLGFGLGKKGEKIYPGADDNGSGSTTIMELARRFGAIKNRQGRRLVFVWFSGEERGLLGSKHYCEDPMFPLESTAAMVNLDMVGRLKEGMNPELYAEGFDTGKGLKELLDKLNEEFGFKIVGPHKQQIYGRSDQASFYRKNVPGVFFFTDFHPDYHKTGDTPEKINVAGMAKVASLAEKLVAHLSTAPQRPEYIAGVIKAKGFTKAVAGKLNLTYDPADKSDGVLVESVVAGGAAAKGGILAGDRITAFDSTPIPNPTAYLSAVQQLRPGVAVTITVKRKDMELKLKVMPE